MFAACMLFALPEIKEFWVKSGTHPVYNSAIRPFGGPGLRPPSEESVAARRKQEAIVKCATHRDLIDDYQKRLAGEGAKPNPIPELIRIYQKQIAWNQEMLAEFADEFEKYPELDREIEDYRQRMKLDK